MNLLVTGHAVSNVWDGDRECSGMSKTRHKKKIRTHTDRHTADKLHSQVMSDVSLNVSIIDLQRVNTLLEISLAADRNSRK